MTPQSDVIGRYVGVNDVVNNDRERAGTETGRQRRWQSHDLQRSASIKIQRVTKGAPLPRRVEMDGVNGVLKISAEYR